MLYHAERLTQSALRKLALLTGRCYHSKRLQVADLEEPGARRLGAALRAQIRMWGKTRDILIKATMALMVESTGERLVKSIVKRTVAARRTIPTDACLSGLVFRRVLFLIDLYVHLHVIIIGHCCE